MLMDLTVRDFVQELASDSPAPGGGSVAALSGALGAALISMVCRLTIGKKGYEEAQTFMEKALADGGQLQSLLIDLVDQDTQAFNEVMAAFKLPKETEEEKRRRADVIQSAYQKAAEVPFEIGRVCLTVIELAASILPQANINAISDIGVASQAAYAGLESAVMNVRINLPSIKDQAYVERHSREVAEFLRRGGETNQSTYQQVNAKLA